ncbi:Nin one binding Zn-ribbon like-domain-containing protein [Triangularia verruculosa]|uniref:20S-pre-rRNA D-site endonuclease NOB1 n=1 Tax=Triangularia verruculosa TaxID=2587418 RepID=A0AAN7ATJ8_9PEZI|nr:Nin one binding Zn-ribbon like-domain-containing protein [Triangularia verruculosa]
MEQKPEPSAQAPTIEYPAPAEVDQNAPVAEQPVQTSDRKVHSLVIDANAIIRNDPTVSTLLSQAEELYTIPAVVSEIRDEATRSRYQTTLAPFIKLRTPGPESMAFVTAFARRTGDLQVLSKPDLQLLALTYELEVERNGGDWRLRKDPTQKTVNGKPPGKEEEAKTEDSAPVPEAATKTETDGATPAATPEDVAEELEEVDLNQTAGDGEVEQPAEEEEDDEEGWITPSNIKKYQAKEKAGAGKQQTQRFLQAALITADMAMRNVALRINLNLLDTGLTRITFLKTWVLRCHGCWKVCKDMSKQFCPSCGQATLTRVSCSTDASGNFTLHLKKNFQYNNRGNVYSIPKPTHGSSNTRRIVGGGKNGWGNELILAEDQKEYVRKKDEERRTKYKDLMDEDYLPSILSGSRTSGNGKIKVGAGRNVNAKKKR